VDGSAQSSLHVTKSTTKPYFLIQTDATERHTYAGGYAGVGNYSLTHSLTYCCTTDCPGTTFCQTTWPKWGSVSA